MVKNKEANEESEMSSIQEKMVLYQLLSNRLEEIKKQLTMIQTKMMEYETTSHALGELTSVKQDSDILVPLGSGVYTRGKTSTPSKLLVDIGAGVMTTKDLDTTKQIIEAKKKEIEEFVENQQREMMAIASKLQEMTPELQKAMQESQGE